MAAVRRLRFFATISGQCVCEAIVLRQMSCGVWSSTGVPVLDECYHFSLITTTRRELLRHGISPLRSLTVDEVS